MTSATSATSEGAQGIFSKITFLKSGRSNKKDEVCHSFVVEIFTKSLHRGGTSTHHSPTNITLLQGETLFKYLKNVSVPKKEGGPPIEFNNDGSLKSVEIRIVNLQLDTEASKTAQTGIKKWEEIGVWQATPQKGSINVNDDLTRPILPYNHGN